MRSSFYGYLRAFWAFMGSDLGSDLNMVFGGLDCFGGVDRLVDFV